MITLKSRWLFRKSLRKYIVYDVSFVTPLLRLLHPVRKTIFALETGFHGIHIKEFSSESAEIPSYTRTINSQLTFSRYTPKAHLLLALPLSGYSPRKPQKSQVNFPGYTPRNSPVIHLNFPGSTPKYHQSDSWLSYYTAIFNNAWPDFYWICIRKLLVNQLLSLHAYIQVYSKRRAQI